MTVESEIQAMVDREKRAWDQLDGDALVSLFHPDASHRFPHGCTLPGVPPLARNRLLRRRESERGSATSGCLDGACDVCAGFGAGGRKRSTFATLRADALLALLRRTTVACLLACQP